MRQGCPLSPYLFVLSAEILSLYVKQKSHIEGIVCRGSTYLISQFADDTSLSIMGNPANLRRCFNTLTGFEEVSGLKVNVMKTEAMGLGNFSNPICSELKIQWVKKSTKILGINIAKDRDLLISENYSNILDKIESRLQGWRRRNLSIMGKINIIKCLGISQIVYLFTMLPSPGNEFLKKLEQILYKFIWNDSIDRIKRATLIGPTDLGGLNMIDVFCLKEALNISWVKRLLTQPGVWSGLITSKLKFDPTEENLLYFLRANITCKDIHSWIDISDDNPWHEILSSWCKYNFKEVQLVYNIEEVLGQTIWFNSCIRVGKKPVFYKRWYNVGIRYISDLVTNNKWKSIQEIAEEYYINLGLLEYLGILNAVPVQWRRLIKEYNDEIPREDEGTSNIDNICKMVKVNKETYQKLTQVKCEMPTNKWHGWVTDLNLSLNELDWLDCLPLIHKCTTSTKLRSLGYRFMLRDVLTNNRLIHMGKSETVMCYLCNAATETIAHLYWECLHNRRLWERLKLFLIDNFDWEVNVDPTEMLMGVSNTDTTISMPLLYNLLCLITKRYIHSCKCKGTIPHENGLIQNFRYIRRIEFNIAQKRGANAIKNDARKWLGISKFV